MNQEFRTLNRLKIDTQANIGNCLAERSTGRAIDITPSRTRSTGDPLISVACGAGNRAHLATTTLALALTTTMTAAGESSIATLTAIDHAVLTFRAVPSRHTAIAAFITFTSTAIALLLTRPHAAHYPVAFVLTLSLAA